MYSSRKWLNGENAPSTGATVAYEGKADWSEKNVQFFEISDCHGKIRLHRTDNDTIGDFIRKLRVLSQEAEAFANYLEKST